MGSRCWLAISLGPCLQRVFKWGVTSVSCWRRVGFLTNLSWEVYGVLEGLEMPFGCHGVGDREGREGEAGW
jgi:hypothetical protein